MVEVREVLRLVMQRINHLLTIAESALPPAQFAAYRRAVLREFGKDGLERDVIDLARHKGR
jgi:hypothetical protein